MDKRERDESVAFLVRTLLDERHRTGGWLPVREPDANSTFDEWWEVFRALVNTREPLPVPDGFFGAQDALLQELIDRAGIAAARDLPPAPADARLSLWRGDITTLAADAIVNAANDRLLGCWVPGHYCIDNAIHTYAGVQLRLECARLMQAQGHPEPTGRAKVTPAYNLPSRFVIHTVGPIANGNPTDSHRAELAHSYESCLAAAAELAAAEASAGEAAGASADPFAIAFCCVSTGVFGFPQEEAAQIAVRTVRTWLDEHPEPRLHVVFNVFGARDEDIYRSLLA